MTNLRRFYITRLKRPGERAEIKPLEVSSTQFQSLRDKLPEVTGESITVWMTNGPFIDEAILLQQMGEQRVPVFNKDYWLNAVKSYCPSKAVTATGSLSLRRPRSPRMSAAVQPAPDEIS